MAARNDQANVQNFTFPCKYFRSTCFIMYENPHDRCHLVHNQYWVMRCEAAPKISSGIVVSERLSTVCFVIKCYNVYG